MQSYNPGIERDRVSAEFLQGLEDQNAKRKRDRLETAVIIGASVLAWNAYRNHSGKRT